MKLIKNIFKLLSERPNNKSQEMTYKSNHTSQYAQILNSLMDVEPWCVDFVQVGQDFIEIRGWAIGRRDLKETSFTLNGLEFEQIQYPVQREDIGKLFWYVHGAENSGFICRSSLPINAIFQNGYAVFSYVDKETKQPLRVENNYYLFDTTSENAIPVPSADNRIRVHGGDSESAFLLEGFSTYMKLRLALRKIINLDYNDFQNILDWGCGCGRMTRYFRDIKGSMITGIDIDNDNIKWCRQHLSFGRFENIPLHPPTAFRDSSFDLLIGISIFTHLSEQEQFKWLKELQRIASDGAILLMTFQGDTTICRRGMGYDSYAIIKEKGFLDRGHNPGLDKVVEGNDYRNIISSRNYIMEHWSKYFEIIDIIPGYIGNHQDLVVMRK